MPAMMGLPRCCRPHPGAARIRLSIQSQGLLSLRHFATLPKNDTPQDKNEPSGPVPIIVGLILGCTTLYSAYNLLLPVVEFAKEAKERFNKQQALAKCPYYNALGNCKI
jgi:hypothetical protein